MMNDKKPINYVLTDEDKEEILRLTKKGHTRTSLGKRFGVSHQAISKFLMRNNFPKVNESATRNYYTVEEITATLRSEGYRQDQIKMFIEGWKAGRRVNEGAR